MFNKEFTTKTTVTGGKTLYDSVNISVTLQHLTEKEIDCFGSDLSNVLKTAYGGCIKSLDVNTSKLGRIAIEIDGMKLFNGKFNSLKITNTKERKYNFRFSFQNNEDFEKRNLKPFSTFKIWGY